MSNKRIHFEEYLYLPALTHNGAIIAWGGFFFSIKGGDKWELLDDDKLAKHANGRQQCVGVLSEPYAPSATVFITDLATNLTTSIAVTGSNHAVIRGLQPDHDYAYRVVVHRTGGDHEWAAGPLRDWGFVGDKGVMQPSKRRYENRFRTFPAEDVDAKQVKFVVLGDYGRGVRERSKPPRCQREVADAMQKAFDEHGFRFILTTGDNLYAKTFLGIPTGSSGDEDDDWFYTYFQPYRYLINRVPFFPCVGNHDDADSEKAKDRMQIYDNLYLRLQYEHLRAPDESVFDTGLFYRFRYGAQIEFICLDTSNGGGLQNLLGHTENREFLERVMRAPNPRWRIPYSHHPACCAGPRHSGMEGLRTFYNLRGPAAALRVSFSGHEHNFQYAKDGAMAHFLTGGGGKYREGEPRNHQKANIVAWGGNTEGHFLLVKLDGARMEVTPYGHLDADGKLRELKLQPVKGAVVTVPLVV